MLRCLHPHTTSVSEILALEHRAATCRSSAVNRLRPHHEHHHERGYRLHLRHSAVAALQTSVLVAVALPRNSFRLLNCCVDIDRYFQEGKTLPNVWLLCDQLMRDHMRIDLLWNHNCLAELKASLGETLSTLARFEVAGVQISSQTSTEPQRHPYSWNYGDYVVSYRSLGTPLQIRGYFVQFYFEELTSSYVTSNDTNATSGHRETTSRPTNAVLSPHFHDVTLPAAPLIQAINDPKLFFQDMIFAFYQHQSDLSLLCVIAALLVIRSSSAVTFGRNGCLR